MENDTLIIHNTQSMNFHGEFVVTDPCYYLEDIWSEFRKLLFYVKDGEKVDLLEEFGGACVLEYKGIKILIAKTAYGDGSYDVTDINFRLCGTFSVDSGLMAVVAVKDLESVGVPLPSLGCSVFVDAVGKVEVPERGHFHGIINVDTDEWSDKDFNYWDETDYDYSYDEDWEGEEFSRDD